MNTQEIEQAIDVLVNEMIESGAPNYKGWICESTDGNEYVVTVQRIGGETPSQQLSKSKQQYNELVRFVSSLQLDSVSDDCALEQLLEKHKGE